MNFFKTLFHSIGDSFKIFRGKELLELLYLTYTNFVRIYSNSTIILLYLLGLIALLFTKNNSIPLLLLSWFLNFNCLTFLRPSVDLKNYKYFFSYLLVGSKLLSIFLLIFYLPYSFLHTEFVPTDSFATAIFLTLFGLFIPYDFSALKIVNAIFWSFIFISLIIGFKGLIYHFLLMLYLNWDKALDWMLYILMLDKKLFSLMGLLGFYISPFMVFLILSALDSRKNLYYQIKGLGKGLLVFFKNYPILFILFNIFKLLIVYTYKWFPANFFLINFLFGILFMLVYYFYLSFLTNTYVKKTHEQI